MEGPFLPAENVHSPQPAAEAAVHVEPVPVTQSEAAQAYEQLCTPAIDAQIEAVLQRMDPAEYERARESLYTILWHAGVDALMEAIKAEGAHLEPQVHLVLKQPGMFANTQARKQAVEAAFAQRLRGLDHAA